MDRFVMRNSATGGVNLIPDSSLAWHAANGWVRLSDAVAEEAMDQVDLAAFATAPDLDAPADVPAPEAVPAPPVKSSKEKP